MINKVVSLSIFILAIFLAGCEKENDIEVRRDHFVDKTSIVFDLLTSGEKILLTNITDNEIDISLDFDTTYLMVSGSYSYFTQTDRITVYPQQQVEIFLTAKRYNVLIDSIITDIIIKSDNHSYSDTLQTTIYSYPNDYYELEQNIIDIGYNEKNNSIVFISDSPKSTLNIYYPANRELVAIPVNAPPKCMSISPDGNNCAVGSDYFLYYIDLNSGSVISEIPVSCQIRDIILTDSKWVYFFPRETNRENIHSFNLNTSVDTVSDDYYTFCKAVLDKNQKSIYTVDVDDPESNSASFPKDIRKYDISDGIIKFLYDSKYHGDYTVDGNIFLSDNGEKIFSGKSLFLTSQVSSYDISFNKEISEVTFAVSFTESLYSNIVLIVNQKDYYRVDPTTEILAYEPNSYNFIGNLDVSSYIKNSKEIVNVNSQYVFCNNISNDVYIVSIIKSQHTYNQWAILKTVL